jgi:Fur family transcriptional regulator, ferric uptake regulator
VAAHDHEHEAPAMSALRASGKRMTRQRAAIWEVLLADPEHHLSAEEVAAALPEVNPSTVYRTLDLLVDEGLVRRTDLGGDRRYYEPARDHVHHHLVCESCGAVEHVHDEIFGQLGDRLRATTGFALGDREITLFGRCRTCAGE